MTSTALATSILSLESPHFRFHRAMRCSVAADCRPRKESKFNSLALVSIRGTDAAGRIATVGSGTAAALEGCGDVARVGKARCRRCTTIREGSFAVARGQRRGSPKQEKTQAQNAEVLKAAENNPGKAEVKPGKAEEKCSRMYASPSASKSEREGMSRRAAGEARGEAWTPI